MKLSTTIILCCLLAFGVSFVPVRFVAATPDGMIFPVIGNTNYSDTFYASRASGIHHAIDIFGPKHSPLVSVVDGYVSYVGYPEDSWGWYIEITDADGYRYNYIHINNDTPGSDNGQGGAMYAYGPDMKRGNKVVKGQLLGYMGDSGNAETTPPHLHFEIVKPGYEWSIPLEGYINPFQYLNNAVHYSTPALYPALAGELLPYGNAAGMEMNIARGNLDDDPALELVTGPGPGGGPHVKVFDANDTFTGKEFMAYSPFFYGGIDVAVGDIDGDGKGDIVTGAGKGGGPHVKAFDQTGNEIASFYAYDYRFAGGIRVATGDVDGDGVDEIVTGILGSGGPHIRVFERDGTVIGEFFAYAPEFLGGVDVSVGDVSGDAKEEIITGAGPGGGPHVKVFNDTGAQLAVFYAYDYRFAGGVKVSAGEVRSNNPKQEISVIPWMGGGPHVRVLKGDGTMLAERNYLEVWWSGLYDVAAGDGEVLVGTGYNRRASVRVGL